MPNFSYGGPVKDLFPTVIAQAREAEAAGFDTAFVMDHFYQLPGIGAPDAPMLEAYSALSALATATETIQLSALVTGNTYRNPPMLAKTVTTLDVVSGGRAILGIGAGWFELEHNSFGYEFGTFTERFQKLDEALQIIAPMLRGDRPTFDGKWYHVKDAINEPRVRDDLPILLGGGGEKKDVRPRRSLRGSPQHHLRPVGTAAQDGSTCGTLRRSRSRSRNPRDQLPHVHDDRRGRRQGSRPSANVSRGAWPRHHHGAGRRGRQATERHFVGSPDDVAEQVQTRILDHGIDGVVINLITNGEEPGIVDLAGRTLGPLVGK